jgi:hypothetical protein
MEIASMERSTLLKYVAVSIKYLKPTSERGGMVFTFWIALRQGLIVVNVNKEHLIQFGQRAVRIRATR